MPEPLAKVFVTMAIIALGVIGIGVLSHFTFPQQANGSTVIEVNGASNADAKVVCYDGILYFAIYNHNGLTQRMTGAVIDRETLQPKRCN